MRRNTLLIDADDTLWENNVFFEKLIEDFITLVESCGFTRAYVRHILNETERKNIRQYGYGVRSFGRSLEETYIKLAEHLAKREVLAQIHTRVVDLERTPPKILDGVPETLAYLTERHRLILFTKGEPAEQAAKVERSGLQGFFEFIEIVTEKDPETYGGLVHKHKIVKTHGWMIGNSPSSDEDRPQRGLHPAPAHLDPGTRARGGRLGKTGDPAGVSRTSRPFLGWSG